MVIYIVYEMSYADFETGQGENIAVSGAYKSKKKAMRKAKSLMKDAKSDNLYIDEDIMNKKNPFKNNNWVDLYHEEIEQSYRISSIVMEETKLVA